MIKHRIRLAREYREMKQKDLAILISNAKSAVQSYHQYESGRRVPSHSTLVKIADVLGMFLLYTPEGEAYFKVVDFPVSEINKANAFNTSQEADAFCLSPEEFVLKREYGEYEIQFPEMQSEEDKAMTEKFGQVSYIKALNQTIDGKLDVAGIKVLTDIAKSLIDSKRFEISREEDSSDPEEEN